MKSNCKVMRKVLSLSMAFVVVATANGTYNYGKKYMPTAFASKEVEVNCKGSDTQNLSNNYDEDSCLCDKLEYDASNYETELDASVEKKLNEAGVFDSEIESFSSEDIDMIEDAKSISVQVSYYSTDGNGDNKTKMSTDEINDMIEQQIDSGEMEYEENDNSFLSACANAFGFKGIRANAKTSDSVEVISDSGAVKETLVCTQKKAGGVAHLTYSVYWLKTPKYTGTDVVTCSFENSELNDCSAYMYWWDTCLPHDGVKHTKELKVFKSTHYFYTKDMDLNITGISHPGAVFSFSVEPKNKKCKLDFTTDYEHLKKSVSIDPSVSISLPLSVSITGKKSSYYQRITSSIYTRFKQP